MRIPPWDSPIFGLESALSSFNTGEWQGGEGYTAGKGYLSNLLSRPLRHPGGR